MKVFITKYALTKGIQEEQAKRSAQSPTTMIEVNPTPENGYDFTEYFHGEGEEWHLTRKSASATAEKMRRSKINSLQKEIEKMEELNF